ncbi:MAG: hypothetical protein CVU24_01380 [Betaproteobacteria bacterium HGW-Betaproteobacteria-18]|nr:MAG: hypothetical protein CVU24_01380 [Betaproteobacteria bacterium HGW-Betaproteobacteria-18]
MQVKVTQKSYGPLLVQSGADEAVFFETDQGVRAKAGQAPDALSPSDLILASLATCVAISMRKAAQAMALEPGVLSVSAKAFKAADLTNRFGRFEVEVRALPAIDPDKAAELLTRTRASCTVSNTLAAEVVLQMIQ